MGRSFGPNTVKTSITEMSKIIDFDSTSILHLEPETKHILNYNCKRETVQYFGTQQI